MKAHLIFFLLFLCQLLTGQSPLMMGHNQKFLHFDETQGLVMVETLEPGITLYSLSRKYNVPLDLILSLNPDLEPNHVPMGHPVNIPVSAKSITFQPPVDTENRIWLCYRVQPKETLYRISKTYLHASPEIINTLNPGAQVGIQIGHILHVGWLLVSNNKNEIFSTPVDTTLFVPKDFIKEAKMEGQVIKEEKGLAVWKPGIMSSHYYVLHPTAKLGSYVEITNPMLHRTITAKVAGHIPPGLYQSRVGIVVSPSTARALGVLDQQFFARWRFVE
jgi:hypothetical protein